MSKTFKLNRPKYVEADTRVNKPVSNEKYLVNLTGNPNSCLIKIEKQRVRCLIDSGATTSLISWKFYNNLIFKPGLQRASAHLESVDGTALSLKGKVEIKFEMKSLKLAHTFFVVDGINRNILLGDDWLTSNGVRMYFDLGCIRVKGVYVPLVADKHINSICRLNRSLTVAPNTSYVCCARVKGSFEAEGGSELLVQSFDDHMICNQPGVELDESVVKLDRTGKFPVSISNYTNRYIRLKKGCVICRAVVMSNVCEEHSISHINRSSRQETSTLNMPSQEEIKSQIHTEENHRKLVEELVFKNLDVFAFKDSQVLASDLVKMKIDLTDKTPFKIKPYRLSLNDQKVVDKAVREWEESGIICRSRGPYSSSTVVVDKKDGSKRVCIDFRRLNKITKPYVYPLPTIDQILGKLGGAQYISTFDLKSGFFAVGIEPSSRDYTAFTCARGQFHFCRAPFGLRNSPAWFCELMTLALDGLDDFCSFYMDDIVVWSKSLDEHIRHINQLFERIRKHKLKLSLKKSQFMKAESNHLGFIVSPEGVRPDPLKVESIRTLAPPTNVKECRSFVAMCSYYRRFVPNFAKISEPIVALTKKHARFKWTEQCQEAFNLMKESLTVIPLLSYPDPNKRFILYTDASDTCIGAVLCQEYTEGEETFEKPVYFISHKLNKSQINYSTVEKECFAIMYSLERLHHWVSCSQIICKTDHMPLKYLLSSHFKNRKIASWQMNIAEYNIDIEYLPGKQNLIADLMSRRPNNHEPDEGEVPHQVTSHKVNVIDSSKFDPIKYVNAELPLLDLDDKPKLIDLDTYDEQQKDDSIVQLINNLDTGKLSKSLEKSLIVIDNVLYFVSDVDGSPRLRLYLPDHLTNVMIKGYHDFGHMGLDKTYDNLKVRYYFPNMYKRINEYVSKCVTCQERNMKPVKPPMGEMDIPAFAGCKWAADISGPYNETLSGNKYILTFICLYSSYIVCFAIPDKCSDTICSILIEEMFPTFGSMVSLLTDNGKEFVSGKMADTLAALNIKHITTSIYSPMFNGACERSHRTLLDVLSKKLQGNPESWDLYLSQACAAINFSVNESSKLSPFFLMYNRDPILPVTNILKCRQRYAGEDACKLALEKQHETFMLVHKNLRQAKKRNARYANENAKNVKLEVGDSVYLKQHVRKSKLDRKWQPFYRIVSQKSPYTFVIRNQLDGSIKESHVRHLRFANIDDWEITREDKERQMRKARMVASPDNSDSEPEAEPPLAKLTKMKRRHRSGSSSEEDIPLLELQNRIKARNRQLKREYANRDVSSSTDSSSESDLKTRRSVHNDDSSLEGKDNQDQTPMHYDSETDEYYTDVGSTVPKQESMEVDQVNSVDNNQKEQVKQLLSAVIGLLK